MADWIFEGNPRHYDLAAAVASSREQWWGTPHFRDQMAVGDRVWLQVVGPEGPGHLLRRDDYLADLRARG